MIRESGVLLGLAMSVVLLAGCSSGGSAIADPTSQATVPTPTPPPTAADCGEFAALSTAEQEQVATVHSGGVDLDGQVLDEMDKYCAANPTADLDEAVASALATVGAAKDAAAASALAATEAAARLRWSAGPTLASTPDGYQYEFTISARVIPGSSSDTLNAPIGYTEWTGPNMDATATITNMTSGHNAAFAAVSVVALWKTTLDDCEPMFGWPIYLDATTVLCPLIGVHPGAGIGGWGNDEYWNIQLGPGEALTVAEDMLSENSAWYPKELPEDQAERLTAITANPPDAWYAGPTNASITTSDQPVFVVHRWGPGTETYQMVGSSGLPDSCGSTCRDQAAGWGLEWGSA